MTNPLENKVIVLGITGSIAAYKAAELASKLTQSGALVNVILTESAQKFISALTFQSVTGRKALTENDLWGTEGHVTHIALGQSADLIVIAPASANTIAKLAKGIADNLLTITALAARCPLMVAPAMDAGMYGHPATQLNVTTLKERGVSFIGPAEGHLASGLVGLGRMEEPKEIFGRINWELAKEGSLRGKKIVITAGGTREPIDPVRHITNRSSGRQGYALAQSALNEGADVVLISAPTSITPPIGCRMVKTRSAEEMLNAVLMEIDQSEALIMTAAVSDFRPVERRSNKIKKTEEFDLIRLENTKDILLEVAKVKTSTGFPKRTIGFAAESENLIENAKNKLKTKNIDLIIANDILAPDSGFEVETNQVSFIYSTGLVDKKPLMKKSEVADLIIQQVIKWL
ncbi:MAG: bifunctional phosphopantothenoylcysteine decarboxylase/phosphopantothenate--cysteine ligase CoaBC [Anaerolineaceae bacterium]|nr:bifunctional phosphopantothenoylcysteine decarboxylase/phosphopantothenate--cysteine ligase CoaBC [Anaerolineaceae bacterium]